MLQDATGDPVTAAGDTFVVHMDRESLNDFPEMGKYDVTVTIKELRAGPADLLDDPGRGQALARARLRLPAGAGRRPDPGDVVLRLVRDPPEGPGPRGLPDPRREARSAAPSASSTGPCAAATRGRGHARRGHRRHSPAVRGREAGARRLRHRAVRRRVAGGAGRRHPRLCLARRRRDARCGSSRRSTASTCSTRRPAPRSSSRTSRRWCRSPTGARWRSGRGRPRRGCGRSCCPRRRSWSPGWPRSTPGSPTRSASRRTSSTWRAPAWSARRCAGSSAGSRRRERRAPASTSRWRASSRQRRARRPRSGSPTYAATTSAHVAGVGLAVTDAVALPDGLVLVSAAAEDSPSTYDDGPVVGSALAAARRRPAGRPGRAPAARRRGGQARGAGPGRPARRRARPGRGHRRRRPRGAVAAAGARGRSS